MRLEVPKLPKKLENEDVIFEQIAVEKTDRTTAIIYKTALKKFPVMRHDRFDRDAPHSWKPAPEAGVDTFQNVPYWDKPNRCPVSTSNDFLLDGGMGDWTGFIQYVTKHYFLHIKAVTDESGLIKNLGLVQKWLLKVCKACNKSASIEAAAEVFTPPPSAVEDVLYQYFPDLSAAVFENLHPHRFSVALGSLNRFKQFLATELKALKNCIAICLDAEWIEQEKSNIEGAIHHRRILTQQYSIYIDGKALYSAIFFIHTALRPRMEEVFKVFVKWCKLPATLIESDTDEHRNTRRKYNCNVMFICHRGSNDLNTFYQNIDVLTDENTIGYADVRQLAPDLRGGIVSLGKNKSAPLYFKFGRDTYTFHFKFRDTLLLAPAKRGSLAELGKALGFTKVDDERLIKNNMYQTLLDHPELFTLYGLVDALIPLAWVVQAVSPAFKILWQDTPPTLASQAVHESLPLLKAAIGANTLAEFNLKWKGTIKASGSQSQHDHRAEKLMTTASKAFYGGRNESFYIGFVDRPAGGFVYDLDARNMYPMALCMTPMVDVLSQAAPLSGQFDVNKFNWRTVGFGYVSFRFPDTCPFPCLPVPDPEGGGLIFPLEGVAFASAPEVCLALKMGAIVGVADAGDFVLPDIVRDEDDNVVYPMREVYKPAVAKRLAAVAEHGKGSVHEILHKELNNSLYGKIAQGVRAKTRFDTVNYTSAKMPESAVTNPVAASHATSLARAIVTAAMTQLHHLGYQVYNVTTDGFMTNATVDVLEAQDLYGLRKLMLDARQSLEPDTPYDQLRLWEAKHSGESALVVKTRANATLGDNASDAPAHALARGGYKYDDTDIERMKAVSEEAYFTDLVVKRDAPVSHEILTLPKTKQNLMAEADSAGYMQLQTVDFNYDMKRLPDPELLKPLSVGENTHASGFTKPHLDMASYYRARAIVRQFPALTQIEHFQQFDMAFYDPEYVTGRSLKAFLRTKRPKPVKEADTTDELHYAARCIVHYYRRHKMLSKELQGFTTADICTALSKLSGKQFTTANYFKIGQRGIPDPLPWNQMGKYVDDFLEYLKQGDLFTV